MPTPTGTISLSNVNTELGRSSTANISMNEAAVRTLAGVGGSGSIITMDNLRGKSNASVAISDLFATNYALSGSGGTATARYTLDNNGSVYRTNGGSNQVSVSGEWLTGGSVSLFEAYATWYGSGGTITGTTGSWISLSTTREWTLTVTNNYETRDLVVQIRLASSQSVLDTATITFEVDSAQ